MMSDSSDVFSRVIFDCDSTLTAVEGIDELARSKGRYAEVNALTDAAMEGRLPLDDVYDRRLALLDPAPADAALVAEAYRRNVVPDARAVIGALHAAGKEVFVVSGGLREAVRPFAAWLGVPPDRVYAVDLRDGTARHDPLSTTAGKAEVIRTALPEPPAGSMLVGDGVSDLAARGAVDLFVGFAGVVERPRVVADAAVVVTGESLAPILEIALTAAERRVLSDTTHRAVVEKCRAAVASGAVIDRRGGTR